MPVVMQDKIMNVSLDFSNNKEYIFGIFLGFEDADYYPEKNPDHRLRRERIPVRDFFKEISFLSCDYFRANHGNQLFYSFIVLLH